MYEHNNILSRDESCSDLSTVLNGLKRVFVRKSEVLITAAAQCVSILASDQRWSKAMTIALTSDLPEFLFDSLNTVNNSQLE